MSIGLWVKWSADSSPAVGVISEVDATMPPELPEASNFQDDDGTEGWITLMLPVAGYFCAYRTSGNAIPNDDTPGCFAIFHAVLGCNAIGMSSPRDA